jgi:chromosome segregation ATPase
MTEPLADDAAAPSSTQYDLIRNNNWEHLKDADLDDQRASQRFLSRRAQIGDNHAAENSIIEEVTCINFMCHDKLSVPLGPLINFVVGMNGSGKSAVLTAITLCLGGKASATNRGASLKSLIKGGTDQAILIVKLKNGGVDAYQPDLYGDIIIVERHFSKTGSSGFRLKSSTGRTISTKKGDVDDMIEYYQLQVDNPMNVLTQDAAKSFIQSSTPKQKYQFFVEGVQLQQLDNDYKLILDTCEQIESKIDEGKECIKNLEKKRDDAQAKADIVDQHEDMRRATRVLANQLAWAQVEEVEKILRNREAAVIQIREKIKRAERTAGEKGEAYELTNNAMERAEAIQRGLEEELVPVRSDFAAAEDEHKDATETVMKAHSEQRLIQSSLTEAKQKVVTSKQVILEEEHRIEDANGGAHGRKQAAIAEAQQDAVVAKQALEDHGSKGSRLEEESRISYIKVKDIEKPLTAKSNEVVDCTNRLHTLNSDRGDTMAGFDRKMPQLIQKIRNDGGFREKPIGPIGLHIRLLNPRWSKLLEQVLGSSLNGFVVTSKADQTRLSNILRQIGMEYCPILIGNNQSINIAGKEPDEQYETVLRVLDIDSELVKRQLIINARIEQTLLIQKRDDGHRVMFEGPRPYNVSQCYTMHDHNPHAGHRLAFMGQGNQEIQPVHIRPQQKPRMKTDIESQISIQKEILDSLMNAKNELQSRKEVLEEGHQKCKQAVDEHKRKYRQLKIALQNAEDRVEALEAEFDQVNVEDGRLEAYKTDLAEAERELEIYEDSYGSQALEKEKLNKIASAKRNELQRVKTRVEEHEAQLRKAQIKVRNVRQARQIAVEEKNLAIEAIATLKVEEIRAEDKRRTRAEQVDEYASEAAKISERVPIGNNETAATLDAKLTSLKKQLSSYTRMLGADDNAIYNALEEASRAYDSLKANLEELDSLLRLLKQTFMKRMDMFRKFQRYISSRSRINFNYLLSERAFRGKLSIDHVNKLLDVHVEPDETKKSGKGRATKTLSGGEKSFSSICLLLALWEAMGAPLRCLDEYDVFMDDVNRDVSSRMIVSFLSHVLLFINKPLDQCRATICRSPIHSYYSESSG